MGVANGAVTSASPMPSLHSRSLDRAADRGGRGGRAFNDDAGLHVVGKRHRATGAHVAETVLRAVLYGLASTGTWSPRAKRDQPQWRQSGSRASPCSIVSSTSG